MTDLYRTISLPGEGVYKEKGSKFLAFAFQVQSEAQVKDILDDFRKEYHDARHHCYAWRLGPDKDRYRSNDDGEPSGSAGKPILGQIQSRDLTDVLILVIRYFGGTLLGVGGLINAYRSAASDALDHAKIVEKKVYDLIRLEFEYTRMNAVMKLVKEFDLELQDQQFDNQCTLTLRVWKRLKTRVVDKLQRIEGCRMDVS